MTRLRTWLGGELRGLLRDSASTGAWQGVMSLADLVQLALVAHLLGIAEYGRLALVVGFVVLVGQFFDVRVGAAAMTFGARSLARASEEAAGVFQLTYLVDAATGVLGFAVVALLAPLVGPALVGGDGTTLVLVYALTLLVSTVDNTSISVLRVLDRFSRTSAYGVALEALRIGLVAGALLTFESLTAVLAALLVYDAAGAAIYATAAVRTFRRASGASLLRPALANARGEARALLGMVFHTNVVSYARLAQTQLPTVLVGALAGPAQAGVYKVGMAAAAAVGRLADPLYAAVFPRLARLWAGERRDEVVRLLRHASVLSVLVMAGALALAIAFRGPIVEALGGGGAAAATGVLVLAAVGYAVNGTLFWNGPLLLAAGRASTFSKLALIGAAVQIAFLAALVPAFGAEGAAAAFLASQVVGNVVIAAAALGAVRAAGPAAAAPRPVVPAPHGP